MSRETVRLPKTEEVKSELKIRADKIVLLSTEMEKAIDVKEKERLQLELEIAQKEYEFYRWERDVTGAKKGSRFGVDLKETIENIGVGRNESGDLSIEQPEALDRNHLVMVNMGELDRLNSSGDHKLGDVGLVATYNRIQQVVSDNIREYLEGEDIEEKIPTMFEVYRVNGNDFVIVLKDVNAEIAKKITEGLQGNVEMPAEHGVEAVPLAANNISLRGSFEVLKSIRSVFESESVSEIDKDDAEQGDGTLLITLLRERLFTMNDFVKVRSRLERMVDKIKNPEGVPAEKLYDDFLKKTLGTIFAKPGSDVALDFGEFVQALRDRGAGLEVGSENDPEWERMLFLTSRDQSIHSFQDRYEMKRKVEVELHRQVISDLQKRADEKLVDIPENIPGSVKDAERPEYGSEKQLAVTVFESVMADLGETEGRQILQNLETENNEAKSIGPREVRLAELTLEVEKLKRDSLTGLKERGMLFNEITERIENKKPISVISIDMAFLKFFDKEGGSMTGDNAILAAGKILDAVNRKYVDKGAEAYRVGGDEFVFTINVDDAELVQEVIQSIRDTALEVGPIPEYKGGTGRYRPEMLQFNFGAKGYSEENNPKMANPDTLVHEADARVEIDKAVNRFVLLLQREGQIQRLPVADRSAAMADLDILYAYSAKSIFGVDGKEMIKEWALEYRSGSKSLKQLTTELIAYIAKGLEDKGKKDFERDDLEHVLLRNELIIEMQHAEISKLRESLEKADREADNDHARIAKLKERLNEAEVDRDKVIKFRQELA
jgi:diguanylate cyclase (GGDEF)-like protein